MKHATVAPRSSKFLSDTFAACLGMATGPLAPITAVALKPFTRWMTQRIAAEWSRKSDVVAEEALRASGLDDPEDFCEKQTGDPEMIALTQKVLNAAQVTGNTRKLRGLGVLLGEAVRRGRRDR